MSDQDKPKQPVLKKLSTANPGTHVQKETEPRRKTTTKFSTMVPQAESSGVEITPLQECQRVNLTDDEDFISATSHLSVVSTESGNSTFVSANGCRAQDENSKSVSTNISLEKNT